MDIIFQIAYIDPGTGSIILQGIASAFMVIVIALSVLKGKIFSICKKIYSFFGGKSAEEKAPEAQEGKK